MSKPVLKLVYLTSKPASRAYCRYCGPEATESVELEGWEWWMARYCERCRCDLKRTLPTKAGQVVQRKERARS